MRSKAGVEKWVRDPCSHAERQVDGTEGGMDGLLGGAIR